MFDMEQKYKEYLRITKDNPEAVYSLINHRYIIQEVTKEDYEFIKNFNILIIEELINANQLKIVSNKNSNNKQRDAVSQPKQNQSLDVISKQETFNKFKSNPLFFIKIFEIYFQRDILDMYSYENFTIAKKMIDEGKLTFDSNLKQFLIPLHLIIKCVESLFTEGISQNNPSKQIDKYIETNKKTMPIGLRVKGGYIKNLASPETVFKFNEKSFNVDIDIVGAYTSAQKYVSEFPFGARPLFLQDKNDPFRRLKEQVYNKYSLWEIYNKFILNNVDGIKYYVNCILPSDNKLNWDIDQIFLSSYELHSKEIKILDSRATISANSQKIVEELMEVSDKVSRTSIYKKQLGGYYEKGRNSSEKTLLTIHLDHFSLQYLRALYGVEKFEVLLKNLKVLNFIYYDKKNKTDDFKDVLIDMTIRKLVINIYKSSISADSDVSVDEFKQKYGLKGNKSDLERELLKKFGYKSLYFNIPINEQIIKPVADSRKANKKKAKQSKTIEDKNKYNTYQLIEKLFLNSFYGGSVSPYFKISNSIVGNLITSPVRNYTYIMSILFNGKTAITDGAVLNLFKSIKPIPNGEKTLKYLCKTLDQIQNANYSDDRQEYLKNLSLKEDLPFGIKKIEYVKDLALYNDETLNILSSERKKQGFCSDGFIIIEHSSLNKNFDKITDYENAELIQEKYHLCEEGFKDIIAKSIRLHLIKYLGSEDKKNNLNKCLMSGKIDGSLDIINSNMFDVEVKGVFKDFVTHSMANYFGTGWVKNNANPDLTVKSHPYVDEVKYRGITSKSRDLYLKDFFISAIENENAVRRVKPFLDEKILSFESARTSGDIYKIINDKSIPYKERMYKMMDFAVNNSFGGGDIQVVKVFKEFSLGTFNFLNKEQEDDWMYYTDHLNKHYGQSLEIFFLNPDNTLRYCEMNQRVGKVINEGKNFVDTVKLLSRKTYKQIWGLSDHIAKQKKGKRESEGLEVVNDIDKPYDLKSEYSLNNPLIKVIEDESFENKTILKQLLENNSLEDILQDFLKIKCKEGFYELIYKNKNELEEEVPLNEIEENISE